MVFQELPLIYQFKINDNSPACGLGHVTPGDKSHGAGFVSRKFRIASTIGQEERNRLV